MILSMISLAICNIVSQCILPGTDGYIITKFYKPHCPYSKKIEGIVDTIAERLKTNHINIPIRYVDCNVCDCDKDNIVTVPAIAINKGNIEIARYPSSGTMEEYTKFLTENLQLDAEIFQNGLINESKKKKILNSTDFEKGFDGPWIVYFHDSIPKEDDTILNSVYEKHYEDISMGEINVKQFPKIALKFNITALPAIFGIYNGIMMPYNDSMDISLLSRFVNELIRPSFESIDMYKFESMKKQISSGEPIFVVFYRDEGLAISYFNRISHQYKFKARLYKTNDPSMFISSGVFPKKPNSEDHSIPDEDKVILTVYKDGLFHKYDGKISDNVTMSDWLFASHFPHLTRINNDSFHTIFHGIKPIILLITHTENYIEALEKYSANFHNKRPFSSYVFGAIDIDSYPMFVTQLLPNINVPSIVVFDPSKQFFYYIKHNLSHKNLDKVVSNIIKDYESGELKTYPQKPSKALHYLIVITVIIFVAWMFISRAIKYKKTI